MPQICPRACSRQAAACAGHKSLLLLFFRKEDSSFLERKEAKELLCFGASPA
jgi:hypothetical protein